MKRYFFRSDFPTLQNASLLSHFLTALLRSIYYSTKRDFKGFLVNFSCPALKSACPHSLERKKQYCKISVQLFSMVFLSTFHDFRVLLEHHLSTFHALVNFSQGVETIVFCITFWNRRSL